MASMATSQQAPENWWDVLQPVVPEPYTPPVYTVSEAAERHHNLFSGIRNNTLDVVDSGSYMHGVYTGVWIIAGIGLACMVLAPVMYLILGRSTRCCRRARAKAPGRGGAIFVFAFSWCCAAVGLGLGTYSAVRINNETTTAGQDAYEAAHTLESAQKLANGASAMLDGMVTAATGMLTAAVDCINSIPLVSLLPDVPQPNLDGVTGTLAEYIDKLGAMTQNPQLEEAIDMMYNVSEGISDSRPWRLPVIICVAVLLGVSMLIYLALAIDVMRTGKARFYGKCSYGCSVRFLSWFAFFLAACGWAILSGSVGAAMVTGDFCQDPDTYILQLADNNAVIEFYQQCEGDSLVFEAVNKVQGVLIDVSKALVPILDDVTSFPGADLVCQENMDKLNAGVSDWSDLGYQAMTLANAAQQQFSCASINSLYTDAVYDLGCYDISDSLDFSMLGFLLLPIGFMFMLLTWRFMVAQAQQQTAGKSAAGGDADKPADCSDDSTAGDDSLEDIDLEGKDDSPVQKVVVQLTPLK